MPIIGLCLIVSCIFPLGYLGFGTNISSYIVLLILGIINLLLYRYVKPKFIRDDDEWLPLLISLCAPALIVPVLGIFPVNSTDIFTFVGHGSPGGETDAYAHIAIADYLQNHSFLDIPDSDIFHPYLIFINIFLKYHLRLGGEYFLSAVSSLLGLQAYQMFNIILLVFLSLVPLSIYSLTRYGLGLNKQISLIATILTALGGVLQSAAHHQNLPQLGGIVILPLALGLAYRLFQNPSLGEKLFCGILASGLLAIYPDMVPVLLLPLGVYSIFLLLKKNSKKVNVFHNLWLSALIAIVLNPLAVYISIHSLWINWTSNIGHAEFFPLKYYLFLYTGLVKLPEISSAFNVFWNDYYCFIFSVLYFFMLFWGLWIVNKDLKAFLNLSFISLAFFILFFLFVRPYPYGFYKSITFTQFIGIVAASIGIEHIWCQLGKKSIWLRNGSRVVFTLYLLFLLLSGIMQNRWAHQIPQDVTLTQDMLELKIMKNYLDKQKNILLIDPDPFPQVWTSMLLNDIPLTILKPCYYFQVFLDEIDQTENSFSDEQYFLGQKSNFEDIVVYPNPNSLIWENNSFILGPVQDILLVSDSTWYPLMITPENPYPLKKWRVLKNGSELIYLKPSKEYLSLFFTATSLNNYAVDTIQVVINDVLADFIPVQGQMNFATRPFKFNKNRNRIRFLLQSSEAKDSLRILISNISIEEGGEIDFTRPLQSRVTGIFVDRWMSQEAEIVLTINKKPDFLEISGEAYYVSKSSPQRLAIYINNNFIERVPIYSTGSFKIHKEIPARFQNNPIFRIKLIAERVFIPKELGLNEDPRRLSVRLENISLVSY